MLAGSARKSQVNSTLLRATGYDARYPGNSTLVRRGRRREFGWPGSPLDFMRSDNGGRRIDHMHQEIEGSPKKVSACWWI